MITIWGQRSFSYVFRWLSYLPINLQKDESVHLGFYVMVPLENCFYVPIEHDRQSWYVIHQMYHTCSTRRIYLKHFIWMTYFSPPKSFRGLPVLYVANPLKSIWSGLLSLGLLNNKTKRFMNQ